MLFQRVGWISILPWGSVLLLLCLVWSFSTAWIVGVAKLAEAQCAVGRVTARQAPVHWSNPWSNQLSQHICTIPRSTAETPGQTLNYFGSTPPSSSVTWAAQQCVWAVPPSHYLWPRLQGSATFCTWGKIIEPQIRIVGTVCCCLVRHPVRAAAWLEDSTRLTLALLQKEQLQRWVWECDFCQQSKHPAGWACRQGRRISICGLELWVQLRLLWESLLRFLTVGAPSGALGVFKWKFTFTVRRKAYSRWAVWWSYQSHQMLKAFPSPPTL